MALWCICLLTGRLQAADGLAQRFDFDLPAGQLEQSLQRFTAQSGSSAGMPGSLPDIQTQPVIGRYTALEALQRMLAGSGVGVVPAGPLSFRLERAVPGTTAPPAQEAAEVRIVAAKPGAGLPDRPLPVTTVSAAQIAGSAPMGGTGAALDFDAATSSTNLGPGRNRDFIRGVADSAFLGPSQATVSIELDEARLNYNAPDPDLRLLDVERVEILKGPPGPLHDSGALGGVVRILPQHPDLNEPMLRVSVLAGDTGGGGISSGGSAVVNLPVAAGSVGLRAVTYAQQEAGWIDNAGGRSDANSTYLAGARGMLRAQVSAGWLLDLQAAAQLENVGDSQYTLGTAPTLARSGVLREPRDNDLWVLSAVLRGPLWGGELMAKSSYARQEVAGIEDASASAALFGVTAPLRYHDGRDYHLLCNELRFTGTVGERMSFRVGLAQQSAGSRIVGWLDPSPASGATLEDLQQDSQELALFGELDIALSEGLRLSTGLRLARLWIDDERQVENPQAQVSVMHAATPSVTLDWQSPDQRVLMYLRFAQATRPGGLNAERAGQDTGRFRSDQLSSLDTGVRLEGERVTLQAAVFASRWLHVQSDYLLENGVIGTRNAGDASNLGLESQLRLTPLEDWSSELGGVLQRARLDDPAIPLAGDDPRLPVVPDVRLYALLARDFLLGGWQTRLQVRGDYTGSSRLSFDQDLDRKTPASFTLGAAARLARGRYELQINATNLLDSRADTFAFGNPFSIRSGPQRTPLRPRTLMLQLTGTL